MDIIIFFFALSFIYPISEIVNGIDNNTTTMPENRNRTGLSIFEVIYTILTAILKIIELTTKRMSLSLFKVLSLLWASFSLSTLTVLKYYYNIFFMHQHILKSLRMPENTLPCISRTGTIKIYTLCHYSIIVSSSKFAYLSSIKAILFAKQIFKIEYFL